MTSYLDTRSFSFYGSDFILIDPGNTVAEGTVPSIDGSFVYEPSTTTLLLSAMRRARAFCDIGALHGYFSCLVAAAEPDCIVHAFEANPKAFAVLERNFAANRVRGLPHCVAVNADGADVRFAARSIVDDGSPGSFIVPGLRFDDFAAAIDLRDAVLKIDVHGSEGPVLEGMRESLRTRVSDVLLEIHPRRQLVGDYSYDFFLNTLESAGFIVFEIPDFRDSAFPVLVPMTGEARLDFTDESRWQPEHDQFQRMLFATRDQRST